MGELSFGAAFQGEQHRAFALTGSSGRTWLLIHGFPGTPSEMRPVGEALHATGDSVHGLLLPGFGNDLDSLRTQTAAAWQSHCQTIFQTLKSSYAWVGVAGYSMGGALAVPLAVAQKADALVLIAPFWRLDHVLWHTLPILRHVLPVFKPFRLFKPNWSDPVFRNSVHDFLPDADFNDAATRQAIQDFEVPVGLIDQIRQAGLQGAASAPQVTCPTLIIQGMDDELVLPATTRAYLNLFHNKPQYVELPGPHVLTDAQLPGWKAVRSELQSFVIQHRESSHG